ncbi:MAG TPA: hypothetical protein ENJ09_12975 [Planctomycetes bacterium]|nr:hypothetical protein [Planctomycetota bacterium]
MSKARTLLGLVFLALGLWFLLAVFSSDEEPPAALQTFTSSAQCAECHAEVYDEWKASQHSISWTNPRVQALSNEFANQDCIDCHAPRPVFVTGIGERVLPRTARRPEGVDCISCHLLGDGHVAGTKTIPSAACSPVATLDLGRPDFCAGCHNQHKTVDQWRESDWPDRDQDCFTCHMAFRDGDPNRGRSHVFPGGNDLAMLQRAVDLRARRDGDGVAVELENVGAGHAFPTDERSRRADIFWRPASAPDRTPDGKTTWRHLYRIRDPYRTETDMPSTLVHAGETLRVEIPEVPDEELVVALFYMREPYFDDPALPDPEAKGAVLVHTVRVAPR